MSTRKKLLPVAVLLISLAVSSCGKGTTGSSISSKEVKKGIDKGADKAFAVTECSEYQLRRADWDSEGEFVLREHYTCSYEHLHDNVYQMTKTTDLKLGEPVPEYDRVETSEFTAKTNAEIKEPSTKDEYVYEGDLLKEYIYHSYGLDGSERMEYRKTYKYDEYDKFGNPTHAIYIEQELEDKGYTSEIFYEYDDTGCYITMEKQQWFMTSEQVKQSPDYDYLMGELSKYPNELEAYQDDMADGMYTYQEMIDEYERDEYGNAVKHTSTHMFYSMLWSKFMTEYSYTELDVTK